MCATMKLNMECRRESNSRAVEVVTEKLQMILREVHVPEGGVIREQGVFGEPERFPVWWEQRWEVYIWTGAHLSSLEVMETIDEF